MISYNHRQEVIITFIKIFNELLIRDPNPKITGKIKDWNNDSTFTRFDTILTFETPTMCAIVETNYPLYNKGLIKPSDIAISIVDGKTKITQITLFNFE